MDSLLLMLSASDKQRTYRILTWVFVIGGFVWIINGMFSGRYIFYPFLGIVNWGIAWVCFQASQ